MLIGAVGRSTHVRSWKFYHDIWENLINGSMKHGIIILRGDKMNNKKAKKIRRDYRKSVDKLANRDYRGILLRVCKQRDYTFIYSIIISLVSVILGILLFIRW